MIRVTMNAKPTPISTGKTLMVASSHGKKQTEIEVDGKPVFYVLTGRTSAVIH